MLARAAASVLLGMMVALAPAVAVEPLRGHGGPVRAILRLDADHIATASFDSTIIVWSTTKQAAARVLRFHDGAVNALASLPGGCFASGGEDARIAIWCADGDKPVRVLEGHQGPVSALAAIGDGSTLVSGSFDRTIRSWDWGGGRELARRQGHDGPVTAIAAIAGGPVLSASFDATLRLWPADAAAPPVTVQLPAPVNALALAPDGEIAAAGADGRVRFFGPDLASRGEVAADTSPLGALAMSPDAATIAAAGLRGGVALITRADRTVRARLVGPGLPVWSLGWHRDAAVLLTGGADRLVRFWDAVKGAPLGPVLAEATDRRETSEERGAIVFRACRACHTLTPDDGNRAGPTLHGIFGRRIATAPGYVYSPALNAMTIVWNAETISRLFEIGPTAYTPGTKMPEQTISDPADRAALVEWLERQTR